MGASRRRVDVNRQETMEIVSWFIEPVPSSSPPNQRGPVRVWGSARDGRDKMRWWRSSSIQQRISSTLLKTRFGTHVKLKGTICEEYARRLMMSPESIQSFRSGFPPKWQTILPQSFSSVVFEKKLNEPNPSKEKRVLRKPRSTGKVTKSLDSEQGAPSSGDSKAGKVRQQPKRTSKRKKSVAFADLCEEKNDSSDQRKRVQTAMPKVLGQAKSGMGEWSQSQISSFEQQRNSVPADDTNYWESISSGVPRKTAIECQKFWESTWASPAQEKKSVHNAKHAHFTISEPIKQSSPDISMDLRKGMKSRRRANSAKFRTEVRKIAAAVARATDDEELEPNIDTPKTGNRSIFESNSTTAPTFEVPRGTPGTEVRKRRATVDQQGIIATPEVLARGKTFGLREADHYISLFRRRASAAATEN